MTTFTKSTYRKARAHYIARAVEFHAITERTLFDAVDIELKSRLFMDALAMAHKIVDRGRREKGMFKMRGTDV